MKKTITKFDVTVSPLINKIIPVKKRPQANNVNNIEIRVFFDVFNAYKPLGFGLQTNFFLFSPITYRLLCRY